MGGTWESVVKLTKKALRIVTHDRPMYEDSLSTFITEIESVLNSQSLTSVIDDPNDYNVLKPNHFTLGRQSLPFTLNDDKIVHRAHCRIFEKRDFKENDLVIMKNEHQHHSLWSVGQTISVNKGIDGKVRSVQLRLPNSTLTRPVNTLWFLEEWE